MRAVTVSVTDMTTPNCESLSAAKPNISISQPRERGQTDRRTHSAAAWEPQPGRGHPSLLTAGGGGGFPRVASEMEREDEPTRFQEGGREEQRLTLNTVHISWRVRVWMDQHTPACCTHTCTQTKLSWLSTCPISHQK